MAVDFAEVFEADAICAFFAAMVGLLACDVSLERCL